MFGADFGSPEGFYGRYTLVFTRAYHHRQSHLRPSPVPASYQPYPSMAVLLQALLCLLLVRCQLPLLTLTQLFALPPDRLPSA